MSDLQSRLSELRHERETVSADLMKIASPETLLLMRYFDVRHEETRAEFEGVLKVYQTAKGVGLAVKWAAAFVASCAVIWSIFHGGKPPV